MWCEDSVAREYIWLQVFRFDPLQRPKVGACFQLRHTVDRYVMNTACFDQGPEIAGAFEGLISCFTQFLDTPTDRMFFFGTARIFRMDGLLLVPPKPS